jgi:hypothetical protein
MKPVVTRLALPTAAICVLLLLVWVVMSTDKHPVALIRIVDSAGKPVAGAVIRPDGLRTKAGPYVSGHYGWRTVPNGVANDPVVTDGNGYARVPYPKHVFERIETGQISFSVSHAEFVPDRPFREVTTTPPAGAPWREWADYLWNRIQRKALLARLDPVVLQKGAILKLSVRPGSAVPKDGLLFAQASGVWHPETNFWIRTEPGVIVTRRLAAGTQAVRAVQFDASDSAWFSDVIRITAVADQTNEVIVDLKRGVTVRGQLDATVPRPVANGRVVAHVWPQGHKAQDSPPDWHAWTTIHEDGSFEIGSLPEGDLEVVALCNGFVSTNGPGQFQMRYPQKHLLGTNDLAITVGMEPTARLEVQVTDDKGNPVKDARVSTWPNVRYGEWSATILVGDCYNTSDWFLSKSTTKSAGWFQSVPDFEGTSDTSGRAVIPNLPVTVKEFSVEHPRFALPAVVTPGGDKRRQASVTLIPGQTNHVSVRLEPRDQSPIAHY